MDYKKQIAALIKIEGVTAQDIEELITKPKEVSNGDYCLPCFRFSKALRKSPMAIADELLQNIQIGGIIERVESVAGYLNFKLNREQYNCQILEKVLADGENYGRSDIGRGKTICIDYSSINIAKPFHMGHLSTTVIGAALYRLYNFLGYKSIGINHLGDWGTQFGKLIVAYKLWGNKEDIEKRGVAALLEIYVKFHKEAESDSSLDEQARYWFKQIEDGNVEATALFKWFKEITLTEVDKIYKRLKIQFDSYNGESFYNDKMQPVIDELEEKGLLQTSEGARVVNLDDYKMPPCLIVKADGATLYATRDLAAAFYRKKTYNFYKSLYVVAYQQNLHFKQLFKVIELMDYDWYKDLEHVAFGMVSMEDGSPIKTREGKVILLEDVLNKTVERAYEILTLKSDSLENKSEVAEMVGTGAVIFSALYNSRIKDIVFSYDRVLSFEGETGPYTQYTYARCGSVLRKEEITEVCDYSALNNVEANDVIDALAKFPSILLDAADRYEPSYIARAVMDIAQAYNKFYFAHRIIDAPEAARNVSLKLTKAVKQVIAEGLGLLGIEVPEKM
ncbi:MAG: arginine--tRNA ligase [Clostridia bacterium]